MITKEPSPCYDNGIDGRLLATAVPCSEGRRLRGDACQPQGREETPLLTYETILTLMTNSPS